MNENMIKVSDIKNPNDHEEVRKENTKHLINIQNKEETMPVFKKAGKTYYTLKSDALQTRRKDDRIYYDPDERAYYIVRPRKRSFWGF